MKLKRAVSAFFVLLLVFCSSFVAVNATIVSDDDYGYEKINDSWYLAEYTGDETEIVLPTECSMGEIAGIADRAFNNSDLVSVVVPEGYESVGESAFADCESLTTVTLPSTLTSIGNSAFEYSAISALDLTVCPNITAIPYGMLCGCSALTSFTIPATITSIGNNAFSATGLTSIEVPETVEAYGSSLFSNCSDLSSVVLPDNITAIPVNMFRNCSSLQSFTVPENVVSIEAGGFRGCTSLSEVKLPYGLAYIGSNAFNGDTSLTSIYIPRSVKSIGANAFYPMSVNNVIEVEALSGSYAETYCGENMVQFKATSRLLGDCDNKGTVVINDVTLIQLFRVNRSFDAYTTAELADVNNDGKITLRDATYIQMKLAGMITSFNEI